MSTGGVGGKERIGAGALVGGSNPKDTELVEDDTPEECLKVVMVVVGSCVCQADGVWTESYGPGRLRHCGAAAA